MAGSGVARIHVEVSGWFGALIPPRCPHRLLALAASEHTARLLYGLQGFVAASPSCLQRARAANQVLSTFRAFAAWAVALPRKNGTVDFGGHAAMGAAGVVLIWLNQASEELMALDWQRELLCQGPALSEHRVGSAFLGIARLQTWPWLVDAAALASARQLPAVVPERVLFARSPAEVLIHILEQLRQPAFMVEIGVDRGQTSQLLLEALPNLTLLGVDPYPGRYNGQPSTERLDQMGGEEAFSIALGRYAQYADRAQIWRQSSAAAARRLGSAPDLVFVDGEHDFESCSLDLRLWMPKLRPGGVLAGHDFAANEPGVVRAVAQLVQEQPVQPDKEWCRRRLCFSFLCVFSSFWDHCGCAWQSWVSWCRVCF
ncbi:unnamed protein product [Durusdinium trenchii]|uniref:Class I SAM-dependent methyltransferase n=1 Tax=Durusdinium trenchii TaxID=1381693 RepID=A0ABP0KD42_9DINO